MSGKGSAPRPFSVKDDVFAENYCNTFGHKYRKNCCINCGYELISTEIKDGTGRSAPGIGQEARNPE